MLGSWPATAAKDMATTEVQQPYMDSSKLGARPATTATDMSTAAKDLATTEVEQPYMGSSKLGAWPATAAKDMATTDVQQPYMGSSKLGAWPAAAAEDLEPSSDDEVRSRRMGPATGWIGSTIATIARGSCIADS